MQKRGLGARKNIHGPYRLCLTDQTLSLVKIGAQDNSDSIEISVSLYEIVKIVYVTVTVNQRLAIVLAIGFPI